MTDDIEQAWEILYEKHCPETTCPASRHVKIICDIIAAGNNPLEVYGADHMVNSIFSTIKSLWETRAGAEWAAPKWVKIEDVDLPNSRLAPFTMIVKFGDEEKCHSIKHTGDYVPDFMTHAMPINLLPQPPRGTKMSEELEMPTPTASGEVADKPLFVPLKTAYYERFKAGTKTYELRRGSDKRWGGKHCRNGRPAVLSKGYGKRDRLTATCAGHRLIPASELPRKDREDFIACFGHQEEYASVIYFEHIKPSEPTQ